LAVCQSGKISIRTTKTRSTFKDIPAAEAAAAAAAAVSRSALYMDRFLATFLLWPATVEKITFFF
jgi:hypothetical protein